MTAFLIFACIGLAVAGVSALAIANGHWLKKAWARDDELAKHVGDLLFINAKLQASNAELLASLGSVTADLNWANAELEKQFNQSHTAPPQPPGE